MTDLDTGCHCAICRQDGTTNAKHGIGGYNRWRCRCDICVGERSALNRQRARVLKADYDMGRHTLDDTWRTRRRCGGVDPNVFFPVGAPGTVGYKAQLRNAQAICAGCPVRLDCLTFALDNPWAVGVFGGEDEHGRQRIRRERRRGAA